VDGGMDRQTDKTDWTGGREASFFARLGKGGKVLKTYFPLAEHHRERKTGVCSRHPRTGTTFALPLPLTLPSYSLQ